MWDAGMTELADAADLKADTFISQDEVNKRDPSVPAGAGDFYSLSHW
jgi:hypothetical protein